MDPRLRLLVQSIRRAPHRDVAVMDYRSLFRLMAPCLAEVSKNPLTEQVAVHTMMSSVWSASWSEVPCVEEIPAAEELRQDSVVQHHFSLSEATPASPAYIVSPSFFQSKEAEEHGGATTDLNRLLLLWKKMSSTSASMTGAASPAPRNTPTRSTIIIPFTTLLDLRRVAYHSPTLDPHRTARMASILSYTKLILQLQTAVLSHRAVNNAPTTRLGVLSPSDEVRLLATCDKARLARCLDADVQDRMALFAKSLNATVLIGGDVLTEKRRFDQFHIPTRRRWPADGGTSDSVHKDVMAACASIAGKLRTTEDSLSGTFR